MQSITNEPTLLRRSRHDTGKHTGILQKYKVEKFYKGEQISSYNPPACCLHLKDIRTLDQGPLITDGWNSNEMLILPTDIM